MSDPRAASTAGGLADTYSGGIDVTEAIDRFHGKYEVAPDGCWLWTAVTNRDGYGSFWNGQRLPDRNGKRGGPVMVLAHRWAYEHFVGPIPKGLNVLHHCDQPACVNPDHFFLGTQADNVRDCAEKGRRNQSRPGRRIFQKLSAEIHDSIRVRCASGEATRREVAEEYGVATQTIDYIINKGAR